MPATKTDREPGRAGDGKGLVLADEAHAHASVRSEASIFCSFLRA